MIQKIDKKGKAELLVSTFFLAVFSVLVMNVLGLIIYLMILINTADFETISLSFSKGYFVINEKKIGVSIFLDLIGILILWILMILHTLRSIHKSLNYIL